MKLRVVILARRYWPLVGGHEHALAHLAQGVKSLGVDVTVLTPRWQPDWPDRLDDHGVRVFRLPDPPRGFWSHYAWRRQLKNWLVAHRDSYDLVYVTQLGSEATAAMQASEKTNRPYVVRPRSWTEIPIRTWQRRGKQILQRAAGIAADGPSLCAALTAAGCPREMILEVPDGVPMAILRTSAKRLAARQELAEADPVLALKSETPLALYAGPLANGHGLERLLEAWRLVVEASPAARLWLVGDGPERERLARHLQRAALAGRVMLVSPFDTMDSFYQAADLFVQAGSPQYVPLTLREAMAAGLPCIVSDARALRFVIEPGWQGLLAAGESAGTLADAILNLFSDSALAQRLGEAAGVRARESFDLAKVAAQHVHWWIPICEKSS